jgi:type I restriction enzyme S subunit
MIAKQLKNSILQMAVQGKLVPQDPNDEPASVLLEKIRAEKQRLIKEGKIKKNKQESVIFRGSDSLFYEKFSDGKIKCINDEIPFEIPKSWEWVRLNQIGQIIGGGTPKTENNINWENGNISWLTPADMRDVNKYIARGSRNITKHGLENSSAQIMPKGTIVYSSRAPIGYIAISTNELCTNQGFKSVILYLLKNSEYLYYALIQCTPDIQSRASGTTFKEISGAEFGKTMIPLPPLAEQKRIVEQVEKLLRYVSEYEKAKQKLISTSQQFQKSVLQYAMQGKLVPQDPSDEPASVLLEKIKAEKQRLIKEGKIKKGKQESTIFRGSDDLFYEKFSDGKIKCINDQIPFGVPRTWIWTRLGDLLFKLTDGTHNTPPYTSSGVPFLSVKDISSGQISFERTKFISQEKHDELYKRCDLQKGDILLTKVGTTGIPVLIDTDKEFSLFVSVALLKFSRNLICDRYLIVLLKSPLVQDQCIENTRGVGNKNWVIRDIANTLVVLPPLAEQKRIVEKIEKLMSLAKKLQKKNLN